MASSSAKRSSALSMSENDDDCVVCYKKANTYSIGECDHPVCHECSTRMRVLCERTECPICRKDMEMVAFVSLPEPFRHIKISAMRCERRYSIYFENSQIMAKYDELLEHRCHICPQRTKFQTFSELKRHVTNAHELHYCELCVTHLKIFTHERKAYSRSDLALHRRKGDPDDKSHRGHPMCEYCNQRYLDEDSLYKHLRQDHYHCHFCDIDGHNQYYCDYSDLRDHFKSDHFLCEEGDCINERFTAVFRTKLDYQAHWSQNHTQTATKHQIRMGRTVEVDFSVSRRNDAHDSYRNNRGRPGASQRRHRDDLEEQAMAAGALPPTVTVTPQISVDVNCAENFPSLGEPQESGSGKKSDSSKNSNKSIAHKVTNEQRFSIRTGGRLREEDFPALGEANGSSSSSPVPSRPLPVETVPRRALIIQKQESHTNKSAKKKANVGGSGKSMQDDFPALSNQATGNEPVSWVQASKVKTVPQEPKRNPQVKNKTNFSNNDFPSLEPSTESRQVMGNFSKKNVQGNARESPVLKSSSQKAPQNDTQQKSKKSSKKKVLCFENDFDDETAPREDFSMVREGDYQSLASRQSSNISVVKLNSGPIQKSSTELEKVNIKPSKASADFPSLGSSCVADVNSNWVANKAVKAKPNKKENRKPETSNNQGKSKSSNNTPVLKINSKQEPKLETKIVPTKPKKTTKKKVASLLNGFSDEDGPRENFSMVREGDYESLAPSLSSNISVVRTTSNVMRKSLTELENVNIQPSKASADFPSLSNFDANDTNCNWVANKAVKGKPIEVESNQSIKQSASDMNYEFICPSDFEQRNKALIDTVIACCQGREEKFIQFKHLAELMRSGRLQHHVYYNRCKSVLGKAGFLAILPELLSLLPDIETQQGVYKAYIQTDGGNQNRLKVCSICSQVLIKDDMAEHRTHHNRTSMIKSK